MPWKVFEYSACSDTNERPINSKCKRARLSNDTREEDTPTTVQMDINRSWICLKSLSGRMTVIRDKTHNKGQLHLSIYLFIWGLRRFQHCTGHITTGSWKGRGNQYIQFVRVLYCKLPTNGKQLPAFRLEAVPGIVPRPQRWEARVLPLCHRGPLHSSKFTSSSQSTKSQEEDDLVMHTPQPQVDQRLQELQTLNHQGKYNYQRGGSNETAGVSNRFQQTPYLKKKHKERWVPLSDTRLHKHFSLILQELNLHNQSITLHSLRPSSATLAFNSNVSLQNIQNHGTWTSGCVWSYITQDHQASDSVALASGTSHTNRLLILGFEASLFFIKSTVSEIVNLV